jgi:hypothetical protein
MEISLKDFAGTPIEKGFVNNLTLSTTATFEKGGEGSKGGKVIGHTKSGKPIYDPQGARYASIGKVGAHSKKYDDFTKQDHHDASDLLAQRHHKVAQQFRNELHKHFGTSKEVLNPRNTSYSATIDNISEPEQSKIANQARNDSSFDHKPYDGTGSGYGKDGKGREAKDVKDDATLAHHYITHKLVGKRVSHFDDDRSNIVAKLQDSDSVDRYDSDQHLVAIDRKKYNLTQKIKKGTKKGNDIESLKSRLRGLQ